jgi:hypothetical protein
MAFTVVDATVVDATVVDATTASLRIRGPGHSGGEYLATRKQQLHCYICLLRRRQASYDSTKRGSSGSNSNALS